MNTISLSGVNKKYGKQKILSEASIVLKDHQFVVLLGENGVGKTTFLKLCAGLIPYESGEVRLNEAYTREKRAHEGMYISDELNVDPFLTLKQVISLYTRLEDGFDAVRAQRWCEHLSLSFSAKVTALSKGQKHLFLLVLAVASARPILFIDELLANLDTSKKEAMLALLTDVVTEQSRLVVMASHSYEEVELLADGAIFLHTEGIEVITDVEAWRQMHGTSLKALFEKARRS